MFTTCADGWRVAVGLADDDPSMVTAKLTRRVYLSRNRSQSSAARARRRDGLAVVGVFHVARREYSFDVRLRRSGFYLYISLGIQFQLVRKKFRVRMVAYRQEESRYVYLRLRAVVLAQQGSRHARFVAQHFGRVVLEEHFDVGGVEYPFLHRFRGPQIGFADYHVDFAAERRQIGRFFAGRVAAAHYRHVFLAVEKAVARRAGAHSLAAVFRLRGEPQVFRRRACRYDDAFGFDFFRPVHYDVERLRRQVRRRYRARADLGSEAFGLFAQVGHQLVAVHSLRIAREVLHFGRRRQLAARFDAFVEHRSEVGPRRVDGRGVARRAAAYYQYLDSFGFHIFVVLFCVRFSQVFPSRQPE